MSPGVVFRDFEKTRILSFFGVLLASVLFTGCDKPDETVHEYTRSNEKPAVLIAPDPAQTKGVSAAGRTNSGYAMQLLQEIRVGKQATSDRIVFQFEDAGLPEWEVKYVKPPLQNCGSGEPVSIAGTAWLQITFRGAQAHTEAGIATASPDMKTGMPSGLMALVRICDFEGEVTWVLGMNGEKAYTPRALPDPSRLVIDIARQ